MNELCNPSEIQEKRGRLLPIHVFEHTEAVAALGRKSMRHGRDGPQSTVGRVVLAMGGALLLSSSAVGALGQGLHLAVASPGAGVTALPGEAVTIAWRGGPADSRLDVSLVEVASHKTVMTIASAIPNEGRARWTLPTALREEGLCGRMYQFLV
jgi:hypothetical protein